MVLFFCFVKVSTSFSRMVHLLLSSLNLALSLDFLGVFKVRSFVVCVDTGFELGLSTCSSKVVVEIDIAA